jgi:hypothetical protein
MHALPPFSALFTSEGACGQKSIKKKMKNSGKALLGSSS